MIKFEELIENLILPLVAYPNDVEIVKVSESEDNLEFKVLVNPNDLGRVIGKGGIIAKAIRTVLYAGASKEGKKIHLDIDSKE
ncbi:MAG: KH domain-containing protein [Acholeplasmatales bacterium]|nr:KH domain-containing protein [Acholeplasmatales bacterium]